MRQEAGKGRKNEKKYESKFKKQIKKMKVN